MNEKNGQVPIWRRALARKGPVTRLQLQRPRPLQLKTLHRGHTYFLVAAAAIIWNRFLIMKPFLWKRQ